MSETAAQVVEKRRKLLADEVGRELPQRTADPTIEPLTDARRKHLLEDALDLYWNELEWERVTEEERVDGEPLAELIFPGFLAYVRGLLLEEVQEDSLAGAEPRPDIVEEILSFLGERLVELRRELEEGADEPERRRAEEALTARLLDLTLREYHGVSPEEAEGGNPS